MIRIILLIIVVILLLITFFKKPLENFVFDPSGADGGVVPPPLSSCGSKDKCICIEGNIPPHLVADGINNSSVLTLDHYCHYFKPGFEDKFKLPKEIASFSCTGDPSSIPKDYKFFFRNHCPLVLTDGDKKMLDNVIDNSVDVDTLNETQDNKSRLNQVLNMAEELSEKVPKLINRFKETQQREKVSENRI